MHTDIHIYKKSQRGGKIEDGRTIYQKDGEVLLWIERRGKNWGGLCRQTNHDHDEKMTKVVAK